MKLLTVENQSWIPVALGVWMLLGTVACRGSGSQSSEGAGANASKPSGMGTQVRPRPDAMRSAALSPPRVRRRPAVAATSARVTRSLLDGPLELTLPRPAKYIATDARYFYWFMAPYRHSRLPPHQRPLEVLLTLLVRDPKVWQRGLEFGYRQQSQKAKGGRFTEASWYKPARMKWPKRYGAHEARRGLLLPAASRLRTKFLVPPRAQLLFDLTFVPKGRHRGPVEVQLTVRAEGGPGVRVVKKRIDISAAGWFHPQRHSLEKLAGQRVTLELEVKKPPGKRVTPGLLFFGRPRVESQATDERPNLVILMLDTVRRDALGCYGQKRVLTPELDGLAAMGTRFENSYVNAPWTRPSIMSMLSGRTPGAAGATPLSFYRYPLDVKRVRSGALATLPDHLARQGYLVRGLMQNYFAMAHERVGGDFGFESLVHVLLPAGPHRADNPALDRAAERFLSNVGQRRFFLFLHYESAHAPFRPPKAVLQKLQAHLGSGVRMTENDRYHGEVMALDLLVGSLKRALKASGQWKRTVILVTSDHGEVLDPVHCFMLPKLRYNTCYGHSPSPYEEVLRVPTLLVGPGVPRGRTVTQITRHIDLVPTLLELLRLPPMPGAQGRSVLGQVKGTAADEEREVYAVGRGIFSLRKGRYKAIYRGRATQPRIVKGQTVHVFHELYDLVKDPHEHRNIVRQKPAVARAMQKRLFARMKQDGFGPLVPRR